MSHRLKCAMTAFLAVLAFWGLTVALIMGRPLGDKPYWPVTLFWGVVAVSATGITLMWVEEKP